MKQPVFTSILAIGLLLTGCKMDGLLQGGSVPQPRGAFEPPAGGTREIADCARLGGRGSCFYTYKLDPRACSGQRCRKLVIYFSGGQMTCPDPADDRSYLARYARSGYVAVCARIFPDSESAGELPYHREGPRIDLLVSTITSDSAIRGAWSGQYLLFSGVSHGATAPVIAMARHRYDVQRSWAGTAYTAACFLDGIPSSRAQVAFLHENRCRPLNSVLSYERAYSRYRPWPRGAYPNLPATWPEPSEAATGEAAMDDLIAYPDYDFAIHDWKLVECGSALPACPSDVTPGAPIRALCAGIDREPGHRCRFASFPQLSHVQCGTSPVTNQACLSWFDAQLASRGFGP